MHIQSMIVWRGGNVMMRERVKVSGYGRPRQMDVEGGPRVTMSQSKYILPSLFLQFCCHFYDLSVRRANFEKGEPLYLILTRNITSYHFKQKITKNQSFCWSCSFEFDVLHSIGGKLSHLLNEIFPKLNSMIELIESLCLSLSQPNLSNLKLSFLQIIGAIFFPSWTPTKLNLNFLPLSIFSQTHFFLMVNPQRVWFHWTKKSQFDRGEPQNPLNIAKWILLFC